MRISKKDYYNKILNDNKNDVKGIWNMLNNIIRNGSRNIEYPQCFRDNEGTVSNMNDVVNGFNNFFVSIGPRLAEEIENPKICNRGGAGYGFFRQ